MLSIKIAVLGNVVVAASCDGMSYSPLINGVLEDGTYALCGTEVLHDIEIDMVQAELSGPVLEMVGAALAPTRFDEINRGINVF